MMKVKLNKWKSIVAAMILLPFSVFAQTPDIYVCGNGSVNLRYSGGHTLAAGDQVIWQKFADATLSTPVGSPIVKTYTSSNDDVTEVLEGGTTGDNQLSGSGAHYYRAQVLSGSGGCDGEISDPVYIHVLPTFTVALSGDGYCSNDAAAGSTITATVTSGHAAHVPSGVSYDYAWSDTNGSVGTNQAAYTLTTAAVGTHNIAVTVNYNVGSGILKSGTTGCDASGNIDVVVTAQPGKPVIIVD